MTPTIDETPPAALLERLAADFGANYAFVLDVFEQYREDHRSVEGSWRRYFDTLTGAPADLASAEGERPTAERIGTASSRQPALDEPEAATAPEPAPAEGPPDARTPNGFSALATRQVAMTRERPRALAAPPPILPGDIAQPIRGGILRLVANMEASLLVPTAMSARTIPVRTLEENRRLLNKNRERGSAKVSVAHVVAWAILRALDTFPRLNDAFAEVDGEAHRVHRDTVRLGIAVDVQRKDGTRTLLVPNLKDANRLTFSDYIRAFEDLVARARAAG